MISKKRYYGLALPIYECAACGAVEVIGSETELEARSQSGWDEFAGHSPHRPWVDAVKIACHKCGETVERIKDVGNPWLDAGIVPFSTLQFRNNPDYWREWFPADWVSESFPGQFRNWFYSLLAMGTVMTLDTEFDATSPFKNLFSYALLRDENGEEMHKSKGNAIWFEDAAEKMGVDVMRWMYMRTPPASNLNFGYGAGDEIKRGFLSTLWNTYSFFITYASIDEWTPYKDAGRKPDLTELDRWAISELNQLVANVTTALEGYDAMAAARQVEDFVEGLSNWYVRRSRRRFWKSESDLDKEAAYYTLWTCLTTVNRLMAPFTPFVAEEMYQNLVRGADATAPESVHLNPWPQADESRIDRELSASVDLVQRLVSLGRAARSQKNLKVRQPLAEVFVRSPGGNADAARVERFADQIAEELNVKRVSWMEEEGSFFDYEVLPNSPVLGPKLGQGLRQVQQELRDATPADKNALVSVLRQGKGVTLGGQDLQMGDFKIGVAAKEGFAAAEESGYAVAVSTEVTPELRDEGLARELVRRIQEMRKSAGYEIADRIALRYEGDTELGRVLQGWGDYVSQETLATSVSAALREPEDGTGYSEDLDVDGMKLKVTIEKA
jgi:isoleucyl-tRNA synthetase